MNISAAKRFDHDRNFSAYCQSDIIGYALWVCKVYQNAQANSPDLFKLNEVLNAYIATKYVNDESVDYINSIEPLLNRLGAVLTQKLGQISDNDIVSIGWEIPKSIPVPVITGYIKLEEADSSYKLITREISNSSISRALEKMLTLEFAGRKYPLVCPDDPLESIGADLSAFERTFKVSMRAWPDSEGRLHVLEAAPITLTTSHKEGFVSGRLFLEPTTNQLVVRVNSQIMVHVDDYIQEELMPFVGTAVILYGKRIYNKEGGSQRLSDVSKLYWILCRLTDPKDDANDLPQAPLPTAQSKGSLCIGATPPWNWQGPNIRTHLLTPAHAKDLIYTTERRFVLGHALSELPDWVQNSFPDVKRILNVEYVTDSYIDTEAVWGTRLGPKAFIYDDLSAVSYLTSAVELLS